MDEPNEARASLHRKLRVHCESILAMLASGEAPTEFLRVDAEGIEEAIEDLERLGD